MHGTDEPGDDPGLFHVVFGSFVDGWRMNYTWSETKQELFRFEKNILVSASAGTGKTAALVELYIRLLTGRTSLSEKLEIDPRRILAITFTERAAAEMKERVLAGLVALHGPEAVRLAERMLTESSIFTFHAFCSSILRSFAYEAGLSPDFTILEEMQAVLLRERAMRDEIRDRLIRRDEHVVRLLRKHSLFTLHGRLQTVLSARHGGDLVVPDKEEERKRCGEMLQQSYTDFHRLLERFVRGEGEEKLTPKNREGLDKMWEFWQGVVERRALPGPGTPEKDGILFFQDWENGIKLFFKSQRKEFIASLKEIQKVAMDAYAQLLVLPDIAALIELASTVDQRFATMKRKTNALDFDDLESLAIHLLEGDSAVRESYQRQFHAILVDESQDTNSLQLRLLDLIGRRGESARKLGLPPTRYLFMGDRKQSIYRFRKADLGAFLRLEKSFVSDGKTGKRLHFTENYRSSKPLIGFVNDLFSHVMRGDESEATDIRYGDEDHLAGGLDDRPETPVMPCELCLASGKIPEDRTRLAEGRIIAERLVKLVKSGASEGTPGAFGWGDIAVLLRRTTHASAYEQAFRERGIPYIIEKGAGLFQRQEVRDIIELVRFLSNPLRTDARISVLRSPAVMLSDTSLIRLSGVEDENWLSGRFSLHTWKKILRDAEMPEDESRRMRHFIRVVSEIRARMAYMEPSDLIEELVERLDLLAEHVLTEERERVLGNVRKFVGIVREWERGERGFDLGRLLRHFEDAARILAKEPESVEQENTGRLRFLTIHQAKGLEFPVVVLPDLGQNQGGRGTSGLVTSRGRRIGMKYQDITTGQSFSTTFFEEEKDKHERHEQAESKRLFYVACTRAKSFLLLSGSVKDIEKHDPSKSENWLNFLLSFIRETNAAVPVHSYELSGYLSPPELSEETSESGPPDVKTWNRFFQTARNDVRSSSLGAFSVTQLSDLQGCERRFLLRRILDRSTLLWMETEEPEDFRVEEGDDSIRIGTLVHAYLESLPPHGSPDREDWERFLYDRGFSVLPEWADTAWDDLENAGAYPSSIGGIRRVYKELPFISEIELPSGSSLRLKGQMDAVCLLEDGNIVLIDYKYARFREEKQTIHEFQIRAYADVLRRSLGTGEVRAYLGYLRDRSPWREIDVSVETLRQSWRNLETRLLPVLKNLDLPPDRWGMLPRDRCERMECRNRPICHPKNI